MISKGGGDEGRDVAKRTLLGRRLFPPWYATKRCWEIGAGPHSVGLEKARKGEGKHDGANIYRIANYVRRWQTHSYRFQNGHPEFLWKKKTRCRGKVTCIRLSIPPLILPHFDSPRRGLTMQSDDVIWSVINQQFCSYKVK